MNVPESIQRQLRDLPEAPGCYLMRDRRGVIIYVGKAASLRKRVQSYFRQSSLRRADPKLRGMLKSVCSLEILVVRSEAEAILTEGRLIKEYKPRYNVSFKDDKRFLLLRADPDQPYPRFELCRIRKKDHAAYFGPYVSSAAARATLDFIEKRFGLRKCTPLRPDAETYRHCINDIVRYCSAPCVGKTTEQAYKESFAEACAFLKGERPAYLRELKEAMTHAAAELKFEEAIALRDTCRLIQAAIKQRWRMASTPAVKREDALIGIRELKETLGLPSLPRCIEAYDISNISGTSAVASMVCFVGGMPSRARYRRFKIKTVTQSDDPGMMREVIRRRFTRMNAEKAEAPDLVLVDGGITQVRAAREELDGLGRWDVPVAGLAKRQEEIYADPEKNEPVRLPESSKALRVLQGLRDEAHRFALTYHRELRGRRIRESLLDEIEGIGPLRKQRLLLHFGSVRRLMKASEDEIAKVEGIGYEMAGSIYRHLATHSGKESGRLVDGARKDNAHG